MTEKKKFISYVKLNFDLESKVSDLTQLEFKCVGSQRSNWKALGLNPPKIKLNINLLIFRTISEFRKILTPIAQKYDLKNDLIVIRDAITESKNLNLFWYDDDDDDDYIDIDIIRDKLEEYECRIVWWFLPNKIRRHYFQQTLSDLFGKAQVKEIMKTLSEEYHLF